MNNDKNGNFGNGFLFGLIIGVAICLLFTTKKGRAILSELIENGERALEDFVEPKGASSEAYEEEIMQGDNDEGIISEERPLPFVNGHKKRLFRGIRKK
jgi:hypothetical protein